MTDTPHRGVASARRHCERAAKRWAARAERDDRCRCVDCRSFLPSAGAFPQVHGACAAAASPHDQRAVAAGLGCAAFAAGPARVDASFLDTVHARWRKRFSAERDGIAQEGCLPRQCGGCCFYVPLRGHFRRDWGLCANPASGSDGCATFEHDGCADHRANLGGWPAVIPRGDSDGIARAREESR